MIRPRTAVVFGRGGVGKTVISSALAAVADREGVDTVIVDAESNGYGLSGMVSDSIQVVSFDLPEEPTYSVALPGGRGVDSIANTPRAVEYGRSHFDLTILDAPILSGDGSPFDPLVYLDDPDTVLVSVVNPVGWLISDTIRQHAALAERAVSRDRLLVLLNNISFDITDLLPESQRAFAETSTLIGTIEDVRQDRNVTYAEVIDTIIDHPTITTLFSAATGVNITTPATTTEKRSGFFRRR